MKTPEMETKERSTKHHHKTLREREGIGLERETRTRKPSTKGALGYDYLRWYVLVNEWEGTFARAL